MISKFTSTCTIQVLIEMNHIEEFIKPLVLLLNANGIHTVGSCEGHVNNIGNCEYPWIDFHQSDVSKLLDLLSGYDNRPEILIQLRNDSWVIDMPNTCRIFPYSFSLEDGREKFKKLEEYLIKK